MRFKRTPIVAILFVFTEFFYILIKILINVAIKYDYSDLMSPVLSGIR